MKRGILLRAQKKKAKADARKNTFKESEEQRKGEASAGANISEGAEDQLAYTTIPPRIPNATYADYPEGVTECYLDAKTKGYVFSIPDFPSPLPHPPKVRHCMAPSLLSNGNLAIFAKCNIRKGDLIMAERPLLLAPAISPVHMEFARGMTGARADLEVMIATEKLLEVAFGRMFKENQEKFMALPNLFTAHESGPLYGRMKTNGLGFDLILGEAPPGLPKYSTACQEISRINLSCAPNASLDFDPSSFACVLVATQDIKKGQEIFIQYEGYYESGWERDGLQPEKLKCGCLKCASEPS